MLVIPITVAFVFLISLLDDHHLFLFHVGKHVFHVGAALDQTLRGLQPVILLDNIVLRLATRSAQPAVRDHILMVDTVVRLGTGKTLSIAPWRRRALLLRRLHCLQHLQHL